MALERGPLSVHALPLDATYVINVQIVPLRHSIARLPHGETFVLCGDEFRKYLHLQVFGQILHHGHLQMLVGAEDITPAWAETTMSVVRQKRAGEIAEVTIKVPK